VPGKGQAVTQHLRLSESHIQAASRLLEEEGPCQQVLEQLNEARRALTAAGSLLLYIEIVHCWKALRDNPCQEQRYDQLAQLINLYPLANQFNAKFRDFNDVK
jgi:DNA-binding FrmR family transcriptional regulator